VSIYIMNLNVHLSDCLPVSVCSLCSLYHLVPHFEECSIVNFEFML